jgi:hypothetical protein
MHYDVRCLGFGNQRSVPVFEFLTIRLHVGARQVQSLLLSWVLAKFLNACATIDGGWLELEYHGKGLVLTHTTEIEGDFFVLGARPEAPVAHALAIEAIGFSEGLGQRHATTSAAVQNQIVWNWSVVAELLNGRHQYGKSCGIEILPCIKGFKKLGRLAKLGQDAVINL